MVDTEDQAQRSSQDRGSLESPGDEQNEGNQSKRIARTFTITVCLLLLLALCVFWLISYSSSQTLLQNQADRLGETLAIDAANRVTDPLIANDLISINVILGSLIEDSSIAEVAVLDVDDKLLSSSSSTREPPQPWLPFPMELSGLNGTYTAPITLADSTVGRVRLLLDLSYIEVHAVNNLIALSAAALGLILFAALTIWTYYQSFIGLPARLLAFSLHNVRHGEIETCPEPKADNELTSAIRQFNVTAEFLREHTFLDPFDAQQQDQNSPLPEAGIQDTTLLVVHLSNYHYLSSTSSNAARIKLLNKFYFSAAKISQLYNGEVANSTEDELVINFAAVQHQEEQAFYAICAGQLFLQLLSEIGEIDGRQINPKFRLAVHSGSAVDKLYSPLTQKASSLTGQTLDLARDICKACPDNALLISAAAFNHAGAGSRIEGEEFMELGDQEKTRTYLGLEPMSDYRVLLERQAAQLARLYQD